MSTAAGARRAVAERGERVEADGRVSGAYTWTRRAILAGRGRDAPLWAGSQSFFSPWLGVGGGAREGARGSAGGRWVEEG